MTAAAEHAVQPGGPASVRTSTSGTARRAWARAGAVGPDERARRVGDRYLRQPAGGTALHRGQAGDGRETVSRTARFTGCRIVIRPTSLSVNPSTPDATGSAFLPVGVEQAVRGAAVGDEGQLPGQVVRRPSSRCSCPDRRPASGCARRRRPGARARGGRSWSNAAGTGRTTATADRRSRWASGARCATRSWISVEGRGPSAAVAGVGHDHPPAVPAHRDAGQRQAVRAEEQVHRVVAASAVQRDVGQQPVLRVRLPFERQPELVAHPAVRAVAADDVTGADLDLVARGVAQRRVDGVAVLGRGGPARRPARPCRRVR